MMKRKFIVSFFLFLGCCSFSYAKEKIILLGDSIEYDNKTKIVTAKKNVKLNFSSFKIKSDICQFNINESEVSIPESFSLIHNKIDLKGSTLDYSFKKMKGKAESIESKIDKVFLQGKQFIINNGNIQFKDTVLTSCSNKTHKHYSIKAEDIYIYPQWGYLVSNNNTLHIKEVPILWFPSFPYGSRQYSLLEKSSPIPDIGSNEREGFFVKSNTNIHINSKLSGQLHLGYLEKLGLSYGFSPAYIFNEDMQIEGKIRYHGIDGWGGGATLRWNLIKKKFGVEKKENEVNRDIEKIIGTFNDNQLPISTFRASWLEKELIYNYRVDVKPKVELLVNPADLNSNFQTSFLIQAEDRLEEGPTGNQIMSKRVSIENTTVSFYNVFNDNIKIKNSLQTQANLYKNNTKWINSLFSIEVSVEDIIGNPKVTFTKSLYNKGESPFELDQNYSIQTDEIGVHLFQKLGDFFIAFEGNYPIQSNIKNLKPRFYKLSTGLTLHCITYEFSILPIEKQVRFGVNLL